MWNRLIIYTLAVMCALPAMANPTMGESVVPPGSFTRVDDGIALGLGIEGPLWCYDEEANAILITAKARAVANCELKMQFELEKQKVKYDLEVSNLRLRVETLTKQHEEILLIKNVEIERLTEASLKRPNDYTAWWTAGGFATGVLVTLAIFFSVQ